MKKRNVIIVMSLLIVSAWACESALGGTIIPGEYYTWGISNDVLSDSVPDGSIVTEAVLTIHNVTNIADNENEALYIHLLDNPPLGFVSNSDYGSGDFFENEGIFLTPDEQSVGTEDLVYTLGNLNDESSSVWDIFGPDFELELADGTSVAYSSAVLEIIDYAGNGTPFGFSFDPNGNGSYSFDEITLDLTVESFEGTPGQSYLTFTTGGDTSLIGHWKMEETDTSFQVVDSAGTRDGTASANTTILATAGKVGSCFDFSGSHHVRVSDHADFSFGDGTNDVPFSISAWVYYNGNSSNQTVISKDELLAGRREWNLIFVSNMLYMYLFDDNGSYIYTKTSSTVLAGWHFIAATYDGGGLNGIKIYLDGQQAECSSYMSRNYVAMNDSDTDVLIGSFLDASGAPICRFGDKIDDVMIYDVVLGSAEIAGLYENVEVPSQDPESAVGITLWSLEDNTADTMVTDGLGTHNGTVSANTTILATAGKVGSCFDFSGSHHVRVSDHADFSFGDGTNDVPFSISAWVYYNGNSSNQTVISKDELLAGRREWNLIFVSNMLYMYLFDDNGSYIYTKTSSTVLAGWHFIAATYDGGGLNGIKIYLDGQQAECSSYMSRNYVAMNDSDTDVLIGSFLDASGAPICRFGDKIDEVMIYDVVLGSAEIAGLYENVEVPSQDLESAVGITLWSLEDNAADTMVTDGLGTHDGTASANTTILATAGKVGSCFDFSDSHHVRVSDHPDFSFGDGTSDVPFSISAWVYYNGNSSNQTVISKDELLAGRREWNLIFVSNMLYMYLFDDNGSYIYTKTSSTVLAGWHFIAAIYDGGGLNGIKIYLDGQQAKCSSYMSRNYVAMNDSDTDVLIGSFLDASGAPICRFEDKIDDVMIYDGILSEGEIIDLYNEGGI